MSTVSARRTPTTATRVSGRHPRGHPGRTALRIIAYLVLVLFTLAVVYPLIAILFNSFKTQNGFFANPWGPPGQLVLANFLTVWEQDDILQYLLNSLIVAACTVVLTVALAATAGYAFAKFRFRGSNVLFFMFAVLLIVPAPTSIIPLYVIISDLQLINTYGALILPYTAGGLPLSIYLMRAFFVAIPTDLTDAARIDGCSELTAFLRVVLPISRPGLATVAILAFINSWNEFFLALIFIHNPALFTLPLGLQQFFLQYSVQWPDYFAGLATATVPIIVVYLILQRQFISGLTAGAVRG